MKIDLFGGFGEKGRTCLGVTAGDARVLLDAGIKVGAAGREYYPALDEAELSGFHALFLSHAHEDHVGALAWMERRGFRGRIFLTAETRHEYQDTLAGYADPVDLAGLHIAEDRFAVFAPGEELHFRGLRLRTGRSGHVVGGVWFAADAGGPVVTYSADILPDSPVFAMDPLPAADLLVLDASYGADPVPAQARAEAVRDFVRRHPGGVLMPTPQFGRSLELFAMLDGPVALAPGMLPALEAQARASQALRAGAGALLRRRFEDCIPWDPAQPLPAAPLLCHDAMGTAGPAVELIPRARAEGYPVLFTGHLPPGSPGYRLRQEGRAEWIRVPTHPTLDGLVAVWEAAGRPRTLGHSCGPDELAALAQHLPTLETHWRTGECLSL